MRAVLLLVLACLLVLSRAQQQGPRQAPADKIKPASAPAQPNLQRPAAAAAAAAAPSASNSPLSAAAKAPAQAPATAAAGNSTVGHSHNAQDDDIMGEVSGDVIEPSPSGLPVQQAAGAGHMQQAKAQSITQQPKSQSTIAQGCNHPSCPLWPSNSSGQAPTSPGRPEASNIFSELSPAEYTFVKLFLFNQSHLELDDLTAYGPHETLVVANYIHSIIMEIPSKASVLRYLDSGGPKPPRKARATLVLGKATPPVVRDVLVTLDDDGETITVHSLQKVHILSSEWKTAPYRQRPQGPLDENGVNAALARKQDKINAFLKSAFDGYSYGDECGSKCVDWTLTYAQVLNPQFPRGAYIQFVWYSSDSGDGLYIHSLPLQALVVADGARLEKWHILEVWFDGRMYESVNELVASWEEDKDGCRSTFQYWFPEGEEGLYSNFRPRPARLEPSRGSQQPVGVVGWEPYGRRFTISKGNRVDWLGWSLYVGYTPQYGPRFWDISFKSERIVYELSLQEALAVYGAGDLTQANSVFLDSAFGLGYNMKELAQGIDCPMTAAFMDVDVFFGGASTAETYHNAICIFEHNPDLPVIRHYSSASRFYGAVPGAQLIIRMISTMYSKDYIHDLILGVDGSVDVRVLTTGYVHGTAMRTAYRKHYGYPLFYNVTGTVHAQVMAWKVDVDIAGTSNSVNMHRFTTGKADNGVGDKILKSKYSAQILEKEDETAFVATTYKPRMPVIINEDVKNVWDSPRGYKVLLKNPLANLEPDDYERAAGLGFWKWNFVATKHKQRESHSSSFLTQSDLSRPAVDLASYVDGESIRQKDVVVWVNSGVYKVPMAEDAPSVSTTSDGMMGFALIPFNWGDENLATDMVDMIQVSEDSGNRTVPLVKTVLDKCSPKYEQVPFLKNGFGPSAVDNVGIVEEPVVVTEQEGQGTETRELIVDDDFVPLSAKSASMPRCRTQGKWRSC